MKKGESKVVGRIGGEVKVRFWPADNVQRRVEKLLERGMMFEYVFMELGDIVNELGVEEKEVLEVVGAERGRDYKGEPFYEVKVRLGEGGKHLRDDGVEYIVDWALEEYGKKVVDKRIGYLPI